MCISNVRSWVTPKATITVGLWLFVGFPLPAAPGEIDTAFRAQPQDNSPVSLAVQGDGKLVVGSVPKRVFPLRTDGNADGPFAPAALPLSNMSNVRVTAEGSVLVNGLSAIDTVTPTIIRLAAVQSPPVQRLVNAAPVPAGSLDPSFDPGAGFDHPVTAMALQGTNIVVAGKFTWYNGQAANNVARVQSNGAIDDTFDAGIGAANLFYCDTLVAAPDGSLYVGGDFNRFNGVQRWGLAKLNRNGGLDQRFVPALSSGAVVSDLHLLTNGTILAAGCPDSQCSESLWRMRLDGALDPRFNSDSRFSSHSYRARLAVQQDGKIVVGGGAIGAGLLRFMPGGRRDLDFQPPALLFAQVSSILELSDGRILVSSRLAFTMPSLPGTSPLLRLSSDGALETRLLSVPGIHRLNLLSNGDLLAAADQGLLRISPSLDLDTNFVCRVDGSIYALAVQPDGNIVIGGDFTAVNGVPRSHIARVFGSEQAPQPFLLGPFVSQGGFEIQVSTVAQRTYYLEWKENLSDPAWHALESVAGDGSFKTVSDTTPASSQRFYRVRVE